MVRPPGQIFPTRDMGTGRALAKGLRPLTACNIQAVWRRNVGWVERSDTHQCRYPRRWVSLRLHPSYELAFNFSAAFGAKYVKIPSAPARLKPSRLSIIARSPSIQPLLAAAAIIAYSPDTW